jgi:hypothetical protein
MGEKGNLLDISEEVFANLAEQGPQFWIAYEQYKDTRLKTAQAQAVVVEHREGGQRLAAERPKPPATG